MVDLSVGRGIFLLLSAASILIFGPGLGSSTISKRQEEQAVESISSLAHFENAQGSREPLRLPLTANPDESWLRLVFSEYSGLKARVSIGGVEVGGETGREGPCGPTSARVIVDWLAAALVRSERFELVAKESASASYLVYGSIVDCSMELGTAEGELGRQRSSEVSMSFRAEDGATGQVLYSSFDRSRISERHGVRLDEPEGLSRQSLPAVARVAVRANLAKAVYGFVEWNSKRPWSGKVVAVEDGQVTIDAGSRQGLAETMLLRALVSGKELVDPESGRILGSISEPAGKLQIVEVGEDLAVAAILEGCEGIRRGDRVELEGAPAIRHVGIHCR